MKGVARGDRSTDDYTLTLQFPLALHKAVILLFWFSLMALIVSISTAAGHCYKL